METVIQLEIDLKAAMKAGDDVRRRTIRMVLAAIRQMEIDKQVKLDDITVIGVIQKEIKTRRDDAEEARGANRLDIASATEAEVAVLQGYLPQALSSEELSALVEIAIAETGAVSPADMGKVMKLVIQRVAGRATGSQISAIVHQSLQRK
jgi:uncharacterized protein YqeY